MATGLRPLSGAWQRLADAALATLDTSNSQGWALVHLARLGTETRQADLARAIGITEASLVRTLHQLEHGGFVTRRPDPDDRRTNRLVLTETGAAIADAIDARLVAIRAELLDGVADADLATTVRTLELVARRIVERRGRP
ncbi:MAG: MarR family winged helix-turn-helix transcriptional regulator [Sphingomonas sp.]